MENKHYEKLEKVTEKASFLLWYMKSTLESLDNGDFDYLSREDANARVISILRKQLKELEEVICDK